MKKLYLKNGVIIADGAMGTRIIELGVNLKETPSELLNGPNIYMLKSLFQLV